MSTQTTTTFDVFLSYPMMETRVADAVAHALEQAGLDVFWQHKLGNGEDWQDTIWQALAECAALIAILPSEDAITGSVAVEVGAFKAWNKPIYVIQADGGNFKLPSYLADCPVYPVSRLDDVVIAIRRGLAALSEDDREVLATIYRELGTPADQLLMNPAAIERVAREFHLRCGKRTAGERLVQELLRLRKIGKLPRLDS